MNRQSIHERPQCSVDKGTRPANTVGLFSQGGDVSGDMWGTDAIDVFARCSPAPLEFMPCAAWILVVEHSVGQAAARALVVEHPAAQAGACRVHGSKLEQVLEWQARIEAERAESITPTSASGQHGPAPRRARDPQ